jgi:hypothetical protein
LTGGLLFNQRKTKKKNKKDRNLAVFFSTTTMSTQQQRWMSYAAPSPYTVGGTLSRRGSQALVGRPVGQKRPNRDDSSLNRFPPNFSGVKRQRISSAPPTSMDRGFFSSSSSNGGGRAPRNVSYVQDGGAAGSHGAANAIVSAALVSCERVGEAGPLLEPGALQFVRNLLAPNQRGGARDTVVSTRSLLELNAFLRTASSENPVVPTQGECHKARNARSDFVARDRGRTSGRSAAPAKVFVANTGRDRKSDAVRRRNFVADFSLMGVHLTSHRGNAARGWEKGVASVALSGPTSTQNLFFFGDASKNGVQAGDALWLVACWLPSDPKLRTGVLAKFFEPSDQERKVHGPARFRRAVNPGVSPFEGQPGCWQLVPYVTRDGAQPPRSLYLDPYGLADGYALPCVGKVVRADNVLEGSGYASHSAGSAPQNQTLAVDLLFTERDEAIRSSMTRKLRSIVVAVKA